MAKLTYLLTQAVWRKIEEKSSQSWIVQSKQMPVIASFSRSGRFNYGHFNFNINFQKWEPTRSLTTNKQENSSMSNKCGQRARSQDRIMTRVCILVIYAKLFQATERKNATNFTLRASPVACTRLQFVICEKSERRNWLSK